MADQLPLFTTRSPIEEAFLVFHRANPDVYAELVSLALKGKRLGLQRGSINQLFEVLRWESLVRIIRGDDDFKLNNNHRPYYARLIMDAEPTLKGWFEIRKVGA